MWRQGDILIESTESIPERAVKRKKPIVTTSKATGHQHKILEKRVCRLYEIDDEFVLEVFGEQASLVHPEHDTIVFPRGLYRVWRQRELTRERGTRFVLD
ncbi:MAG: hypothetical protein AAFX06_25135 [Planctomycetota bacterium]